MTVAAKPLPVNLHIGGKQISHGSAGVFKHVYSHSGEVQAEIPLAGPEQMNEAVEAAAKAFQEWRRWKPADRRDILLALGNLMTALTTNRQPTLVYAYGSADQVLVGSRNSISGLGEEGFPCAHPIEPSAPRYNYSKLQRSTNPCSP